MNNTFTRTARVRARSAGAVLAACALSVGGLALSAVPANAAPVAAAPAAVATAAVADQVITIQDRQNHNALASADGEGSRIVARTYRDGSTRFRLADRSNGRIALTRGQDREVAVESCDGSMAQRFDLVSGTEQPPTPAPEQRFLQRLNELRAQYGKAPVRSNPTLAQAAQCNAGQMEQRRVSGHFCDSAAVARGLGYSVRNWGEIAFYGPTTVDAAFDGWVKSPQHLGIMIGDYTEVGLSRVGTAAWNADFATR
ncbi:CAP domain-containing protein [Kitasatospora purpeofusca]|uniref:CAP domain-containing protein n=1 Tax=Kitasatospora purpeofusca TaxID=67352 RepID=UPI002254AAEC|nr:CAP domain-containing protein [Kitasatospora purpeofusca]MCX4755691.1 CAP domain-containing protein [Kitasatospora purpeofusca]WSR36447.1 CAP domain-containing protein [Kitasatospora purpeofusca]